MSQCIWCLVSFYHDEYQIYLRLLWNDSTVEFVSYFACGILQFPTHHIFAFCNQCYLRYWMKSPTLRKFVESVSISCSAQKLRPTSMGHPQECIILPSIDRTLDISCGFTISLTTFSTHSFQTCHKHNKTRTSNQTFPMLK